MTLKHMTMTELFFGAFGGFVPLSLILQIPYFIGLHDAPYIAPFIACALVLSLSIVAVYSKYGLYGAIKVIIGVPLLILSIFAGMFGAWMPLMIMWSVLVPVINWLDKRFK